MIFGAYFTGNYPLQPPQKLGIKKNSMVQKPIKLIENDSKTQGGVQGFILSQNDLGGLHFSLKEVIKATYE